MLGLRGSLGLKSANILSKKPFFTVLFFRLRPSACLGRDQATTQKVDVVLIGCCIAAACCIDDTKMFLL